MLSVPSVDRSTQGLKLSIAISKHFIQLFKEALNVAKTSVIWSLGRGMRCTSIVILASSTALDVDSKSAKMERQQGTRKNVLHSDND